MKKIRGLRGGLGRQIWGLGGGLGRQIRGLGGGLDVGLDRDLSPQYWGLRLSFYWLVVEKYCQCYQ